MELQEKWVDVEGYEGLYQVSNLGRVKSMPKKQTKYEEKILALTKRNNGYLFVNLSKNQKSRCINVHRLVAMAFVPNLENKPVVNHKDYDRTNNRADNLEWCTTSENVKYSSINNPMTFRDRFLPKSTNEKYISRANKRPGYVVYVKNGNGKRPYSYKYFSDLETAIRFRNEYYGWD